MGMNQAGEEQGCSNLQPQGGVQLEWSKSLGGGGGGGVQVSDDPRRETGNKKDDRH